MYVIDVWILEFSFIINIFPKLRFQPFSILFIEPHHHFTVVYSNLSENKSDIQHQFYKYDTREENGF